MKDILILSENKKWRMELAELFKKDLNTHPLKWIFVSKRTDIISELSNRNYDALILNSGLPVSNLQIIFKYLASTEYINIPIFFISENFSEFNELLANSHFPKLNLISSPVETISIVQTVHSVLFPVHIHGAVDSEVKINLEFLKTFIDASKYILESFCLVKNIHHLRPHLYKFKEANTHAIEGRIHLKSTFFEGEFIIGLTKETYLSILKIVLAQDDSEITHENEDFAGEIVNMIYGQAKTVLNLSGHNFEKVFPKYEVAPAKFQSNYPVVVVPLETSVGIIELLFEVIRMDK